MRRISNILAALFISAIVPVCLWSQGGGDQKTKKPIEVTIPSFLTGENVGAIFFLPQVERFNKNYEGVYRLIIEACPQASYADKIKQLALQKKLPVLISLSGSGTTDIQWFQNVAVKNGLTYDLSAWLNKNPAIKQLVVKDSLEYSTIDGKVIGMPLYVTRPIGLFYNTKLYNPGKPIRDMTMDEFLAAYGANKIAFQTVDNAWTTGLFLSAIIAGQEGGYELLQKYAGARLYDYTAPQIVAAVEKLQSLFKTNASANAIGAAYADAANNFMSGGSALIANGPWMANEFAAASSGKWSNGFDGANVHADMYPGNIGLVNNRSYGNWWVSGTASKEETELALKFLEFITTPAEVEAVIIAEGGSAPNLKYSDSFYAQLKKTPVLSDLAQATTEKTRFCPYIMNIMPSSVGKVEFGKLLPKLADGSLTARQFCEELTKKAESAK